MEDEIKYSQAIEELEEILRKMQSDTCDIDLLTAYTKRATELLKICKERLTKVDEQLKQTLEEI